MKKQSEILIYQTPNNQIEVRLENETIWLDSHRVGSIFGVDRSVIVKHIRNIYDSDELGESSTCAKITQLAADGKMRQMNIYNLDVIIAVGYRVNSKRATQFRIWATSTLKDHLTKGFTINQKRLDEKGLEEFEEAIALVKKVIQSKHLKNEDAVKAISDLKRELVKRKEASELFGYERGKALEGILASIYQTFGGKELYPTIEEKA